MEIQLNRNSWHYRFTRNYRTGIHRWRSGEKDICDYGSTFLRVLFNTILLLAFVSVMLYPLVAWATLLGITYYDGPTTIEFVLKEKDSAVVAITLATGVAEAIILTIFSLVNFLMWLDSDKPMKLVPAFVKRRFKKTWEKICIPVKFV